MEGMGAQKSVPANDPMDMAELQGNISQSCFTRINDEYEETNRTVTFLDQALEIARRRQKVLASAIDCLNSDNVPSAPTPSLR